MGMNWAMFSDRAKITFCSARNDYLYQSLMLRNSDWHSLYIFSTRFFTKRKRKREREEITEWCFWQGVNRFRRKWGLVTQPSDSLFLSLSLACLRPKCELETKGRYWRSPKNSVCVQILQQFLSHLSPVTKQKAELLYVKSLELSNKKNKN